MQILFKSLMIFFVTISIGFEIKKTEATVTIDPSSETKDKTLQINAIKSALPDREETKIMADDSTFAKQIESLSDSLNNLSIHLDNFREELKENEESQSNKFIITTLINLLGIFFAAFVAFLVMRCQIKKSEAIATEQIKESKDQFEKNASATYSMFLEQLKNSITLLLEDHNFQYIMEQNRADRELQKKIADNENIKKTLDFSLSIQLGIISDYVNMFRSRLEQISSDDFIILKERLNNTNMPECPSGVVENSHIYSEFQSEKAFKTITTYHAYKLLVDTFNHEKEKLIQEIECINTNPPVDGNKQTNDKIKVIEKYDIFKTEINEHLDHIKSALKKI